MFTRMLMAASVMAMVAVPSAAEARHRNYGNVYYGSPYYDGGYGDGYYGGYDRVYVNNGYYDGRYYGDRYYGRRHRDRCGNGTTGLIVGGAAGALIGREIARSC